MELCFDLLLRWRKALKITCFAHKNGCILFLSLRQEKLFKVSYFVSKNRESIKTTNISVASEHAEYGSC